MVNAVKDVVGTRVRLLQANPPVDESEPLLNLKMRDLLNCPDQYVTPVSTGAVLISGL